MTIVTPSLDQGSTIRDTIESVLAQDHPAIEHLILDGGSTDQTAAVVAAYGNRVTWISERDRGQSDAINKGLRLARGEIVSWLNSDDVLLPGAVSAVVDAFRRHPEAGAVYGDGHLLDENGSFRCDFPSPGPFDLWRLIYVSEFILQPASFYRRAALDEVGLLDERLHWAMDWDLFIRLGRRYPMVFVPQALAAQREYAGTKTASGGWRRFRELSRLIRRHGGRRYPPAWFNYGLETARTAGRRWLEQRLPASWARRGARLLDRTTAVVSAWAVLPREGWYGDGWAGPRLELLVRRRDDDLVMDVALPPSHLDRLAGQTLTIRCDGRRVATVRLAAGEQRLSIPVEGRGERTVAIRIDASRSFVPRRREPGNEDPRRLSYLLRHVGWSGSPDTVAWFRSPPGPATVNASAPPRPASHVHADPNCHRLQ